MGGGAGARGLQGKQTGEIPAEGRIGVSGIQPRQLVGGRRTGGDEASHSADCGDRADWKVTNTPEALVSPGAEGQEEAAEAAVR